MPLAFAAIAPHGFPIVPVLSDDADGALATRAAMEDLGRRAAAAAVEVLVVVGPHGIRVAGAVCLADAARAAGVLHWRGRTLEMNVPLDGALTDAIAAAARAAGIPVAMAGFAGNRRDQSAVPLDWGTMVPLWFLGHGENLPGRGDVLADPPTEDVGPPAVIITPSRELPRESLVDFGRAVADAAGADSRRVGLVASCDWGHAHRADGPYGFHPKAAEVDAVVVTAIRAGQPLRLLTLPGEDAAAAAIDGLWQVLVLGGALERVPMRPEVLCYEAPTYYGMLTAAFAPAETGGG